MAGRCFLGRRKHISSWCWEGREGSPQVTPSQREQLKDVVKSGKHPPLVNIGEIPDRADRLRVRSDLSDGRWWESFMMGCVMAFVMGGTIDEWAEVQ